MRHGVLSGGERHEQREQQQGDDECGQPGGPVVADRSRPARCTSTRAAISSRSRVRRRSARMPVGRPPDRLGQPPRQRPLAGTGPFGALLRRGTCRLLGGGLAFPLGAALGAFLAHASRPSTQLRSSRAPASPDFSGWNWVAHSGPFSTAATNRSPPCSAQVHERRARAVVGDQGPVADAVRVHEVEALGPRRRRTAGCPGGTSTVFQPMCGTTGACSRSTTPGHSPQPSVSTPCSTPRSNRTCMPTQMPSTGAPAGEPTADDLAAVHRAQAGHAGGERADAGHDEPVGVHRGRAVGGQRDLGAGALERAHGRAEVARPVVEDDDARSPLRARPWWTGRPVSRGSIATASRSARATALNCASTMWCGSRAGQHADVQGDLRVVGDRLEDVPGQRAEVRRHRSARTPGPPARRCARSRAGRRRRRRPAPAPRRAARARRRSDGCRPCRRAPRAAPGRARSRCPRRCGGRRCAVSPSVWTVRSISECRPNAVSMWS